MNHDALQLLRDADPVPSPATWSETEIRAAVAAIVADDTPGTAVRTLPRRRWAVPALAAAAVVAVAIGVAHVADDDAPTPAAGSGPVTCQVSTDGGRARTSERLATAKSVIDLRAKALGSRGQSFDLDPAGGTIVVRARGIDADAAGAACHATTTALRPLVVAAVPVDASAPTSAEPLKDLGFRVPRDETQAAALTSAQRARLAAALSHTACSSVTVDPDDTGAVVRCAADDGKPSAYLLGPALAANADVAEADAVEPSTGSGGSAQWTVSLSFGAAAQRRIASFTTAHNTGSTSADGGPSTCAATTRPSCADFVAMEVDGRVLQVPVTNEPIVSQALQVSGQYTEATAKALATDYSAASIGLRLR